jgi:hypothetical protein
VEKEGEEEEEKGERRGKGKVVWGGEEVERKKEGVWLRLRDGREKGGRREKEEREGGEREEGGRRMRCFFSYPFLGSVSTKL